MSTEDWEDVEAELKDEFDKYGSLLHWFFVKPY